MTRAATSSSIMIVVVGGRGVIEMNAKKKRYVE
jgi:hypothetical protein